jgi:hypothetical protein
LQSRPVSVDVCHKAVGSPARESADLVPFSRNRLWPTRAYGLLRSGVSSSSNSATCRTRSNFLPRYRVSVRRHERTRRSFGRRNYRSARTDRTFSRPPRFRQTLRSDP